ncbi:zf-HC2 domain-containing protein [Maioricimonas sp. JC845]|uniref:zf-HC2 domain-containing protein n=1 Tax=Maioricimonas sp. JC845 TaxID=3232138 RepID=UPI0034582524
MNCREARTDIPLWLGHDLDDAARCEVLRRHVATCPDCRKYCKKVQSAMAVLEQADAESTYISSDSMWPQLSERLEASKASRSQKTSERWLPVVAMSAACSLLLLVVWGGDRPSMTRGGAPVPQGMLRPANALSRLHADASASSTSDLGPMAPAWQQQRNQSADEPETSYKAPDLNRPFLRRPLQGQTDGL